MIIGISNEKVIFYLSEQMQTSMIQKCLLVLLVTFLSFSGYSQSDGQDKWLAMFNKKLTPEILEMYHSNAGVDYGNGFYHSRMDIFTSLVELKSEIDGILTFESIAVEQVREGQSLEIGVLKDQNAQAKFLTVTGWREVEGKMVKESEFIWAVSQSQLGSNSAIDMKRDEWVKYSNQHEPEQLVQTVYHSDALYFNNGQLSRGHSEVSERYSYMNYPKWQIELIPKSTVIGDDVYAFEIGTYVSTGKGIYVLVWQKFPDSNEWLATYDFNF